MNQPQQVPITCRRKSTGENRRGVATIEAAIILPVMFLVISATVEISTAIYLKESLKVAAYEGARNAINRDATDVSVRNRVENALKSRNIKLGGKSITTACSISPAANAAEKLEPIKVTVTAPTADNVFVPFSWLKLANYNEVSADVTMLKEFTLETGDDD